jgi:transcriptional regulator GlxA family with amidase domain
MDHRIASALALLDECPKIAVSRVAASTGLSPTHFRRLFLREVGESPRLYATRQRMALAATLLRTTHLSVKQIAAVLGVNRTHLVRQFTAQFGCPPRSYRMVESATK